MTRNKSGNQQGGKVGLYVMIPSIGDVITPASEAGKYDIKVRAGQSMATPTHGIMAEFLVNGTRMGVEEVKIPRDFTFPGIKLDPKGPAVISIKKAGISDDPGDSMPAIDLKNLKGNKPDPEKTIKEFEVIVAHCTPNGINAVWFVLRNPDDGKPKAGTVTFIATQGMWVSNDKKKKNDVVTLDIPTTGRLLRNIKLASHNETVSFLHVESLLTEEALLLKR